jgi:hypothetical protein
VSALDVSKAAHLRQIGPAPQGKEAETGRNPGKFHTAVWDTVGRSETLIDQESAFPTSRKRYVRHIVVR